MDDTGAGEPVRTYRRRWWVALPLTILSGVGYLYLGRPGRFALLVLWNLLFLVIAFHGLGGRLSEPFFYMTFTAFALLPLVAFLIDVVVIAVRERRYALRWYNRWWIYLIACFVAGGMTLAPDAILGRSEFAVRSFVIPSASLAPTLVIGDYISTDTRAYEENAPDYGELVIFKLPRDGETDYVKRIVGLPGDRIQMRGGVLHINGQAAPRQRIEDYADPGRACGSDQQSRVPRFIETLPNGVSHEVLDCRERSEGDDTSVYTVPPDHFFTMGDNRDNSTDSRFAGFNGVGFVPRTNIYARVGGIIFSKDFSRIGLRPR